MAGKDKSGQGKNGNGATLGFEDELWSAADKMRGHMDPAEYKHVALGLIFLKYISDAFKERRKELCDEKSKGVKVDLDDHDEYRAANVFWVPDDARFDNILGKVKSTDNVGELINEAMDAIEKENSSLKGVLPKDYARPALDKDRLRELVDHIGNLKFDDKASRSRDILGRVYEYFLRRFASQEGRGGGEFYTPQSVVKVLVEMLEPFKGRVYDPCCGSGGMFVQSERFVLAHGGTAGDIAIYGQESNPTTWRLCKLNLAIRGIDNDIGSHNADTFENDLHADLKSDFILANPPFNVSDWRGENHRKDRRWLTGAPPPPVGNANFAWVEHIIYHLAPNGFAGFVLANGSMSSNQASEGEIRKAIVEADLVDCMIALPPQLFYSTSIPACLWFLSRNKANGKYRDRRRETLFIDARKLGHLVDRTHREFTGEEIARIAQTYHMWRGEADAGEYIDTPGFSKSATTEEMASHGYVLTPGRYVGAEEVEDDDEPFEEKMALLVETLEQQFAESARLEATIRVNLKGLGYGD